MAGPLERAVKRAFLSLLRPLVERRGASSHITPTHPRSILVIRQHNQLGDMLCVVPLLRSLRERYPGASITLMTSPVNYQVMRGNRYLNEVMLYEKRELLGRWGIRCGALAAFVRALRSRRFDLVLVPATVSVSVTSDLLAFFSGAPVRIGASSLNGVENPSGFLYTVPMALDWRTAPHRHQTLRNLDVAQPLRLPEVDLSLEMTLAEEEWKDARATMSEVRKPGGLAIGFHPGAGKVPNRWPAERFAEAANVLCREFGAVAVITAGPMDDEPVKAMLAGLNVPYSLVQNQPVRRVAALLKELDLLVSNDTGIMHVGAAVGVPVLSLFGPTDPEQWAPRGAIHQWLRGKDGVIAAITVEEVLDAARKQIVQWNGHYKAVETTGIPGEEMKGDTPC